MSTLSTADRNAVTNPVAIFAWPSEKKFPIKDQSDVDAAVRLIGRAKNSDGTPISEDTKATIKKRIIAIAKKLDLNLPTTYKAAEEELYNHYLAATAAQVPKSFNLPPGMTYNDLGDLLDDEFREDFCPDDAQGADSPGWYSWREDFDDSFYIAHTPDGLIMIRYTIGPDNDVAWGDPMEVMEKTTYIPVGDSADKANSTIDTSMMAAEPDMTEVAVPAPIMTMGMPAVTAWKATYKKSMKSCQSTGGTSCEAYARKKADASAAPPAASAKKVASAPGRPVATLNPEVYAIVMPMKFGEDSATTLPEWIPFMPVPHTYTHPKWGELSITREGNQTFVDNFKNKVYQDRIALDAEHLTKQSGAVAWMTDMKLNENGSIDAKVEWTPRGEKLIQDKAFNYVSPEWYDTWQDPATQVVHQNIAVGGALTNSPFFKEPNLRSLVASEEGILSQTSVVPLVLSDNTRNTGVVVANEGDLSMDPKETPQVTSPPATPPVDAVVLVPVQASEAPGPVDPKQFAEAMRRLTAVETENATLKSTNEALTSTTTNQASIINGMVSDARTKRFNEVIVGDAERPRWFGEPATHLSMMEHLASTSEGGEESEQFKAYVTQQNAVAQQLKMSRTFAEYGSGSGGSTSGTARGAWGRVEGLAAKKMSETAGISKEQAVAAVLQENPQLYTEYLSEGPQRTGE